MTAARVHLHTLGCRLNEAELETWARDFRARGWELAAGPEDADLVVVNTCAVTAEAGRKSRQLLRRAHRANPAAKLVVSGCYATLDAERAAAELGVDLVVGNQDKDHLVEISTREFAFPAMPAGALEPDAGTLLARGRQRAFVKVQDGCRYRCSYCIVTTARGAERSRPIADVVDEVNALVGAGINEVVLAGVHLGGYGSDTGSHLGELIDAILAGTELPRLRLGSLEPWDLPIGFWARFADPRLLPHLHLPMQSGSPAVLRRMSRRCRPDEFEALAAAARAAVPDLNITTDIIVGFPGETEAEWRETLDFVERVGFGDVHVFAYSPRAGTKAATLPDPVSRERKRARCAELAEVAAAGRRRFMAGFVGRRFAVLVEQRDAAGRWLGYTPNYLRTLITGADDQALENRVVAVEIDGIGADSLSARVD
ncbi:MAG: tRNA (N(6)-L-threonylcarbamoyladenosine(37)-C(2))-methylthiotransferase MtaB [Gammaproteobacteria bacterium]